MSREMNARPEGREHDRDLQAFPCRDRRFIQPRMQFTVWRTKSPDSEMITTHTDTHTTGRRSLAGRITRSGMKQKNGGRVKDAVKKVGNSRKNVEADLKG